MGNTGTITAATLTLPAKRTLAGSRSISVAALAATALSLAGCANSAISAARKEMAAGHYAAAHQELVRAENEHANLSQQERRELADGLCLTEYKIGAPAYPLPEQQRACAEATAISGSGAGAILAAIETTERDAAGARINSAIAQGDIAEAEDQVHRYQSIPGADPAAVTAWSHEIWTLVRRNDRSLAKSRTRQIAPAISAVSRQFPKVEGMDESSFRRWVENNATVSGTPLVSQVEIGRQTVNLWVPDDRRSDVALNLDRLARINDALIARCHCDGRTNVALQGSGLPAYLVRLDPETHQSEVIILSSQ